MNQRQNMPFFKFRLTSLLAILPALTSVAESAFPRAVGFGTDTTAGRGGQIIRVTNLNATGDGSFRAALEAPSKRIVVFEVGGVIDLEKRGISISNPFLTIAGQTAPDPGITPIKGGISVQTHDVLIRHISIRPGDAGEAKRSGFKPDGLSTSGGDAYNIVVDHCSMTWAVDENLSASGARTEGPDKTSHKITFSNNIIAEGLSDSSHAKGPHSK
jgi:pectate lyase